ncbi:MAG: hypothetical protein AB8I08_07400 [Sandaracinaceae bacterium]
MSDTRQRATLSVQNPATSMSLGAAWGENTFNNDGFCVETAGRVWLNAYGSKKSSTVSLLSNGGAGEGQLLLQSLSKNLYVMAADRLISGSNASTLIASKGSVKILGGLGLSEKIGVLSKDYLDGDKPFDDIKPDDTSPTNKSAQAYTDTIETVANVWAVFDISSIVIASVLEAIRTLVGVKGSGTSASTASAIAGIQKGTNALGSLVDSARLVSDGVPGLHMYSWGSINVVSPLFTSIYAGVSLTAIGPMVNNYGILDIHATGGYAATAKALVQTRMDGSKLMATAGRKMELGSRKGESKMYAGTFQFGAKGGEALTQVPTLETRFEAATVSVSKPMNVSFTSGGKIEAAALNVLASALGEVVIKNPSYTLTVNAVSGINIQVDQGHRGCQERDDGSRQQHEPRGRHRQRHHARLVEFIHLRVCHGTWQWTGPMLAFV